jgi:hypothetical protein
LALLKVRDADLPVDDPQLFQKTPAHCGTGEPSRRLLIRRVAKFPAPCFVRISSTPGRRNSRESTWTLPRNWKQANLDVQAFSLDERRMLPSAGSSAMTGSLTSKRRAVEAHLAKGYFSPQLIFELCLDDRGRLGWR